MFSVPSMANVAIDLPSSRFRQEFCSRLCGSHQWRRISEPRLQCVERTVAYETGNDERAAVTPEEEHRRAERDEAKTNGRDPGLGHDRVEHERTAATTNNSGVTDTPARETVAAR